MKGFALMNIIFIKEIFFVLFGILGTILAIVGLFAGKKLGFAKRFFVFVCAAIITLYVGFSAYIEYINRNQVFADLVIYIGEPYVINVNGTETDRFVKDADYYVVGYNTGFSLNASIEIRNVKTLETFFYNTPLISEGFRIANFGSGEYDIWITTEEYRVYSERIVLDSTNMSWDGTGNIWSFTAFVFEDFYNKADRFSIKIGDNKENIEYPAFGIYSDNVAVFQIFRSRVDWEKEGLLEGDFLGYKDVYTVVNSISNTKMIPITVNRLEE